MRMWCGSLSITDEQIKQVVDREERKLRQQEEAYRG
jgi:predicted phosphoribosyltransferase